MLQRLVRLSPETGSLPLPNWISKIYRAAAKVAKGIRHPRHEGARPLEQGTDRGQSTLFPAVLDDYVGEDPVRAIDVFFDGLDLARLGFDGVAPFATGRAQASARVSAKRRQGNMQASH